MAMLFDAVTILLSSFYLIKSAGGISRFVGSHLLATPCSTQLAQDVLNHQDVCDGPIGS
jgi:hypothetical protein